MSREATVDTSAVPQIFAGGNASIMPQSTHANEVNTEEVY